jgi:hypothetical protein
MTIHPNPSNLVKRPNHQQNSAFKKPALITSPQTYPLKPIPNCNMTDPIPFAS